VAKAAAEKHNDEDQLAREHVELLPKQSTDKLAAAEAAVSNAPDTEGQLPDQLRGIDDLEPALKAGLQAYFAKKKAAHLAAMASTAAAPGGGNSPGASAPGQGTAAAAAAVAAAKACEDIDPGRKGNEGDEKGDEAMRRRLAPDA
jgi:hypothetical protein